MYYYEVGGMSVVAGVVPRLIVGNKGVPNPQDTKKAFREENIHYPKTTLICLENTHNRAGGGHHSSGSNGGNLPDRPSTKYFCSFRWSANI